MNTDIFSKEYQTALNIFLDVLDSPNTDKEIIYGFVPGVDDKSLYHKAKSLTLEPPFRICFVGHLVVGKKTLIDAFLRQNLFMPSILPEFGNWIKTIQYGEDDVVIFHSGRNSLSTDSLTMSFKEYHKIKERSDIEDFCQKYQYADFYTNNEFLRENQLIECNIYPSFNEEKGLFVNDAMQRSDAVVYLINAVMPFNPAEKEFIAKNYAGKHMKNLFFVINYIDRVSEDQISNLESHVCNQLRDVFTRTDGSFDEKLFKSRVFYTNAYGALMARTNRPINVMGYHIMIDESITGVPEFEKALLEYKNHYSNRIDKVVEQKKFVDFHIAELAAIYLNSVQRVDEYLINLEEECTETKKLELFYQTRKCYLKNIDKLYITLCVLFRHIYSQELTEQTLMEMTKEPLLWKGK